MVENPDKEYTKKNATLSGFGEVLWEPSAESCLNSNLTAFNQYLSKHCDTDHKTWTDIYMWSVRKSEVFWQSLADFYHVGLQGPAFDQQWFPQASLNVAERLLSGYQLQNDASATHEAIISYTESGVRRVVTWQQLRQQVQTMAAFLQKNGVESGDMVAGILPNQLEAVVAALASAYIGAIWTSCSPDFGIASLQDRLGQTEPKLLFVCDRYAYKDKLIDIAEKAGLLVDQISSIQHLIIAPYDITIAKPAIRSSASIACRLTEVEISSWPEIMMQPVACEPKLMPFAAPLYVLYSSGTTGKPKCIIHSAGGTLLQHIKELGLHTDIKPGEKLFYFSTCGWMMWNWLVSGLSVGATLVLFDGNPLHPEPDVLLQLAAREKIQHFGASAKFYGALAQAGVTSKTLDLSSLRTLLSTGSPLLPETFDYIYQHIKSDVRVASISGGTDIISCFALGNPWLPVRRGELQSPGLGMAVAVFNEQGESVINQQGELVCTNSFPSQPLGFWQDENKEKYKKAYFSRFTDIWAQGDFAIYTIFGGLIILGRSDAVLNPGGVRIGTAEIYRQLELIEDVVDGLAVGFQVGDDEEVWLFVQLAPDKQMSEVLAQLIRSKIRTNASPRHVPAKIISAKDLPKTRSGKIAELAVKKIINGQSVDNEASLANPECLDFFRKVHDLKMY